MGKHTVHHGEPIAWQVVDWRRRRLRRAGFEPELALRLARDPRYDLHALIDLIERGCPQRLAERILAPLAPGGKGVRNDAHG